MTIPNRGSFGITKIHPERPIWEISEWFPCREEFHVRTYGMKSFCFYHGKYSARGIAEFIRKVEDKLGNKKRIQVGNTDRAGVCWVQPTSWWMKHATRRSLLTLLLRCGTHYNIYKDNFDEALFSEAYAKETASAIRFFLKGNTTYKGCQSGWVEAMIAVPVSRLHRVLVPEKKKPKVTKTEVARI